MGNRNFATEKAKRNNYDYRHKYEKENYKRISVRLKKGEDSDLVKWLDEKKQNGESHSSVTLKALRNYYEKSK